MFEQQISQRRTFAIISHPDAGKTTLTEKLLWFGGAIQVAGEVRARKASRHATSDWMELEKQRGISVTSSVMQFPYKNFVVNLLDTPGHEDFSEDTYRTLTAVDSAVMVIDSVNGVEAQTIKLLNVCRMRNTPILTFINKLDREGKSPIDLLDEIESVLNIQCSPMTFPIGMGKNFKGVYNPYSDKIILFKNKNEKDNSEITNFSELAKNKNANLVEFFDGEQNLNDFLEQIELVKGASNPFNLDLYLQGKQTPVFFGSAMNNFAVQHLLDALVDYSPAPKSRQTQQRLVEPNEAKFSGFVFKIQANMDPKHRDRIAFLRVCSGKFSRGMKIKQISSQKILAVNNAITFMAQDRNTTDEAFAGDIIGIPNHGTIRLGETFSENEDLRFIGIPNFAPEIFKIARIKNPLKIKQLHKGLQQLAEEGATQLFRPQVNSDLILGAVGALQFDVVAYRLQNEYGVDVLFEHYNAKIARWLSGDESEIKALQNRYADNVATDISGDLVYLAPNIAYLNMVSEKYPNIKFNQTREVD